MKQNLKSKLPKIINIATAGLLVLSVGILIFVTVCIVRKKPVIFFGKSVMQIVTGSMEPFLHVDDCVIVQQINPAELRKGDIIAYVSQDGMIAGLTVMHRIKECLPDGTFITQGDATPVPDEQPVYPEQIQGKFIRKSRFFSWLTSFADFRKSLLLLVMCMTSVMSFYEARTVMQIGKELHTHSDEAEKEKLIRDAVEKEKQRLRQEHYQPDADSPKERDTK